MLTVQKETGPKGTAFTDWSSWKWQDNAAISKASALAQAIALPSMEQSSIAAVAKVLPFKIPPYYAGLMERDNPQCPIRKMAVPDEQELVIRDGELTDPIGDTSTQNRFSMASLVHRYPDRVLLFPTWQCGLYCRHCFRKWRRRALPQMLPDHEVASAISYIASCPKIKEVILSGGDPLMLEDEPLFSLLSRLRQIPHVKVLRIHSRMPAVNPYRITQSFAQRLSQFRPLWMVTHFNHPGEITDTARTHLSFLVDNGLPVLNQAVLLKDINTDAAVLQALSWKLIAAGVQPYYLHHLDCVPGLSHFRVCIDEGLCLIRQLHGNLPGYAVPRYVLDIPGGHGKIPLEYPYLKERFSGRILVETPGGAYVQYREIR